MKSFIPALIEETHSDLSSSLMSVSQAPFSEISTLQRSNDFKFPYDLLYKITVKSITDEVKGARKYEPETGDIIAFTNVKPRRVDDLKRTKEYCHIAYVLKSPDMFSDEITILTSKFMENDIEIDVSSNKSQKLYAVYLMNMTTNIRISKALTSRLEGADTNILKKVLGAVSTVRINKSFVFCSFSKLLSMKKHSSSFLCILQNGENCRICLSGENSSHGRAYTVAQTIISAHNLNESQKDAVLSSVTMKKCKHNDDIKLLWGPPGTGKTKTVASLLLSLFKLKTKTLACAPTNNAVLEVAVRLHGLVKDSADTPECETYGFGDIVLFGNSSRMKIESYKGLETVFLDNRVDDLLRCFSPDIGWKYYLESTIKFLKEPEEAYVSYKNSVDVENVMSLEEFAKRRIKNADIAYGSYKKRVRKNRDPMTFEQFLVKKYAHIVELYQAYKDDKKLSSGMTMEQFIKQRLSYFGEKLKKLMRTLYTHLPTSFIPLNVLKSMLRAMNLLKSLEVSILQNISKHTNSDNEDRDECLELLNILSQSISLPNDLRSKYAISQFCLNNACLVFCTASSSFKLYKKEMTPFRYVVIDEAAQLKECESTIPLQLPGLRRGILIGDERQLPAMVKSKVRGVVILIVTIVYFFVLYA